MVIGSRLLVFGGEFLSIYRKKLAAIYHLFPRTINPQLNNQQPAIDEFFAFNSVVIDLSGCINE